MRSTDYSVRPESLRRLLDDCRTAIRSGDIESVKRLLLERDPGTYEKHFVPRIAAAALLDAGTAGVIALKELVRQAPGAIYPTVIIETLWRTATGQRLPEPIVPFDPPVDAIEVDDATKYTAKLLLDDLIIQSEEDSRLRSILFSFASHSRSDATNVATLDIEDFGSYIAAAFRAASITLTLDLIEEFESLVARDLPESSYQQFLSHRPVFLDPLAARIDSQEKLGTEFITDFVLRLHDFRYVVVEIEKPQDRIFTRRNDFTAAFTHATGQVLDFQGWVRENVAYAQTRLPGIEHPAGLVIIGRRTDLTAVQESKLRRWLQNSKDIAVLTFDDLAARARLLHRSLRLS